jgi:Flp pilus assembly pilin Flp
MLFLISLVNSFRRIATRVTVEDAGQSMVEYALILAVISIAAVGALALLAPQITNAIGSVTGSF